jgi:tetratricopeptide (TPR) repeat protein
MAANVFNDSSIHIDAIRRKSGITLKEIYLYKSKNKNEINNIRDIFYLKNDSREKLLALLFLFSTGDNDKAVQKFRNETGLTASHYDSGSFVIVKYNVLLITALIYDASFYAMAVNYREAINAGFLIGEVDKDSLPDKTIHGGNILPFRSSLHRNSRIFLASAAGLLVILSLAFLARTLSTRLEPPVNNAWISDLREPEKSANGLSYIDSPEEGARLGILSPQIGKAMGIKEKLPDTKSIAGNYTKAIRRDPNNASLYVNRGVAYTLSGHLDSANRDFNKALELNPKNTSAYYNRAIMYAGKSDINSAIGDLESAIAIDPNDKELVYALGALYYKQYEDDPAKPDNLFNKTIEIFDSISGYRDAGRIVDNMLKANK